MHTNKNTTIHFIPVKDANSKIMNICECIQELFSKKQLLSIRVADEKTAHFIDELLWKHPSEGFLPHAIGNEKSLEPILISWNKANPNGAKIILNLSPQACEDYENFEILYELEDHTHPQKLSASHAKMRFYQENNLSFDIQDQLHS